MTTDREKSIELARGIFGGVYRGDGKNDTFVFSAEELEAFYKAAQVEAFEAAAVKCMSMLLENEADHSEGTIYNATLNDCIDAIREMAKEKQNATD